MMHQLWYNNLFRSTFSIQITTKDDVEGMFDFLEKLVDTLASRFLTENVHVPNEEATK